MVSNETALGAQSFLVGFGDKVGFGAAQGWRRILTGTDEVSFSNDAEYKFGGFVGELGREVLIPAGRLGYFVEVKQLSRWANTQRATDAITGSVVRARNSLKDKYRGPLVQRAMKGFHQPTYQSLLDKGRSNTKIIASAANPNNGYNLTMSSVGIYLANDTVNQGLDGQ